jgi:F0F1-type ATP synthase epsilon subunit
MLVHIAKVNGVLFSAEADSLTAPASEGEVTILSHHTQFASVLRPGKLTVKKGGVVVFEHDVERGVLEVTPESATVLL